MLEETDQARIAVKNKNERRAIEDVNRAQADLKRVQSEAHGSTMVPVYQEFISISFLTPIRAEQSARTSAAASHAARSTAKPAAIHQVAGSYTNVAVNTTVAKNNLAAAKAALAQGDLVTADAALADVQEGVKIEATEANMPLARARENLILAGLLSATTTTRKRR